MQGTYRIIVEQPVSKGEDLISIGQKSVILGFKLSTLLLVFILGASLFLRLFRLGVPDTYYFDEVYHAVTAKAYANNNPAGYEWWHAAPEPDTAYEWLHPPLAKLFMAMGWLFFGQNAFAWRLPGALFGTLLVFAAYKIGKSLFKSEWIGVFSAFFMSMDGLVLAQSRIGMNDIYVSFFMSAALGLYWKFREYSLEDLKAEAWVFLFLSGLSTGLAVSSKWSGIFVLLVIGVLELTALIGAGFTRLKWWPVLFLSLVVIPAGIYLLSFSQFFIQGHSIEQFEELHRQIWWYQTNLDATHPYQSEAWQWPLNLEPVWYFVDYQKSTTANIYNLMNPIIAWFGLGAMAGGAYMLFKEKKRWWRSPWLLILAGYFMVWVPWLFSPRIMFFYHYLPAVIWLTIALGYWLYTLFKSRREELVLLGLMFISLTFLSFLYFLPIWIGLPVAKDSVSRFFLLPSWK